MAVTQTQINEADALIRAQYPTYVKYVHGDTFQVNGTQAASASANSQQAASISIDGTSATSQPVPQSQVWLFTDLYTRTTSDTPNDAIAQFMKNGIKEVARTAPLATQLTTNQTRPGLPAPFIFEPNSKLTINTLPILANGTSVVTDTFFVAVTIYDSSFG